jgi:hypothetical protein
MNQSENPLSHQTLCAANSNVNLQCIITYLKAQEVTISLSRNLIQHHDL